MKFLLCCGLMIASACATAGAAGSRAAEPALEQSIRPGVNDKYFVEGAVESWGEVFEGESREVARHRDLIVDELPLRPGMVVGDIGAGTGLFTVKIAERVGVSGKVYATDIVPDFLARIRQRARAAGVQNVEAVLGQERATGLPDGSLDVAFLCNVYHHLEYPLTYLASIARALKPHGVLVLIDFERIEGTTSLPMLKHVRAGKQVVLEELARAGFELVAEKPVLRENYYLVLRATSQSP